jgi:hypothetical protein
VAAAEQHLDVAALQAHMSARHDDEDRTGLAHADITRG